MNGTVIQLKIKSNYVTIIHNLLNNEFWNQTNLYSKGTKMPVLSKKDLLNKIKIYLIDQNWENDVFIELLKKDDFDEAKIRKYEMNIKHIEEKNERWEKEKKENIIRLNHKINSIEAFLKEMDAFPEDLIVKLENLEKEEEKLVSNDKLFFSESNF